MYDHELKVYGQYLAKEQALPLNTSADGNGAVLDLSGIQGAVEVVAKVTSEITISDTKVLTIKLQDKDDDGSYADLGIVHQATYSSSGGANVVAADTVLGRFVLPTDTKRNLKAVLTTDDAAAAGAVSVYPRFLGR